MGVLPVSDAYVWQRRWTPALAEAVIADASLFRAWHVLAAEIAADGAVVTTQADWPALMSGGHAVVPVVRIEGRIDAVRGPSLIAAIRAILGQLPPSLRAQVEIDHDSATAQLAGYADFLGALRSALPGTGLSATALPTWLASPDFPAFAQAVDLLILQVHSIDDPRLGLFDPARAARWVNALARHTSRPFLVAMPAYGARVAATPGGQLLAVSAEMHAMDGTAGTEAAASPGAVADFLDGLRGDPPDGLRGLVWFRLPTADDHRAWSAATVRAVALGQALRPDIRVVTRPGWVDGMLDILVVNAGDTDAALPASVPLPPGCGAADGVGQYRLEDAALTLHGNALLPPHGSVTAGWARCPAGRVDAAE